MLLNLPRIDPRVRRTRQMLQQAFLEISHEKPDFNDITVGEITERAGVNRATFYAHFEDKYALLNYTVQEMFQTHLDQYLPAHLHTLPQGLRPLTLATCQFIGQFLGRCPVITRQNHGAILTMQVQKVLQQILTHWLVESDPAHRQCKGTPELIAMSVSWTIFGAAMQWAKGEIPYTAEELADHTLSLLTLDVQR